MNAVIIYFSGTGNTRKVAEAIARGMRKRVNVRLLPVEKASKKDVAGADIAGFGSGVYGLRHSSQLDRFVESLPAYKGKKAFTFSTSGFGWDRFLNSLRKKLEKKGFSLKGSFSCRGFDNFGPLKLIGGVGKGKPDKDDLSKARSFGLGIAGSADKGKKSKN